MQPTYRYSFQFAFIVATAALTARCKQPTHPKVEPPSAPVATATEVPVPTDAAKTAPDFPTGRFKMGKEPNGTEFWLEVSKTGETYAVNQWQIASGSTEAQLRKEQAQSATWLELAGATGQELKFYYECDGGDHQRERTLKGFATLTRVTEVEILYALVSPPTNGYVWDCNGDVEVAFNAYQKRGEAFGAAKPPVPTAPALRDGSFTAGQPYEALFKKGATWTVKGSVRLTLGDEIDKSSKGSNFKQETKMLSNTCSVEAVAELPGKIGAKISCSPNAWKPSVGNPALLESWPALGGYWIASAKGLQHIGNAETLEEAMAVPLEPDDEERITNVLVRAKLSDAKTCFQNNFSTEESNYEQTICLERSRGFAKTDSAITWNISDETEGLLGKTVAITYAAPIAAK